MSAEDLEKYETEMELSLYREYKDIVGQFSYVVETERRFYLANSVEMLPRNADGEVYLDVYKRQYYGSKESATGCVNTEKFPTDAFCSSVRPDLARRCQPKRWPANLICPFS